MELTINDLKELIGKTEKTNKHPYHVGENYAIRTVTMIYTGKLMDVYEKELVIVDASWVPDSGRWNEFIKSPKSATENEPYPDGVQVIISRGAIIDSCVVENLLRDVK